MSGYKEDDDLDLCIVSRRGLIWTTRFMVVVIAKLFGIHTPTGVCLNLFFDEYDLRIPLDKQNSYIAHELLQMKPVVDKDTLHKRFFQNNAWINRYYPNARIQEVERIHNPPLSGNVKFLHWITHVDRLFKSIQLPIIKHNRTSLFVSAGQLWLFKRDFEKKLKRQGLVI